MNNMKGAHNRLVPYLCSWYIMNRTFMVSFAITILLPSNFTNSSQGCYHNVYDPSTIDLLLKSPFLLHYSYDTFNFAGHASGLSSVSDIIIHIS